MNKPKFCVCGLEKSECRKMYNQIGERCCKSCKHRLKYIG